jgi:hypothetical protein
MKVDLTFVIESEGSALLITKPTIRSVSFFSVPHNVFLALILMLNSHLLGLQRENFPICFPTKISYAFVVTPSWPHIQPFVTSLISTILRTLGDGYKS